MGESSFWYRPTRVVPDQRPLNGRCCCCTPLTCFQTTIKHTSASESTTLWRYTNMFIIFIRSSVPVEKDHMTCALSVEMLSNCRATVRKSRLTWRAMSDWPWRSFKGIMRRLLEMSMGAISPFPTLSISPTLFPSFVFLSLIPCFSLYVPSLSYPSAPPPFSSSPYLTLAFPLSLSSLPQ